MERQLNSGSKVRGLDRRRFLAECLAAAAGLCLAGWGRLRRPAGYVRAARGLRYPGPVRPLDPADVNKPAEWSG